MKQKFANLGHGYLAQNIDTEETQIYVENMEGTPSISTGEFFVATIFTVNSNYGSNIEIVKVVQTDGNYWTVERNQEETSAKEHPQGSRIELRLTADSIVQVYREGIEDRITSSLRSKTDLGFLPNEKGELQFDASDRTVTLVANGIPVYWFGKELKLNTVSIQFEDVAGGRYIKLNPDTLELEEAGEYPSFEVILVAYIHWSVEQQDFIICGDERHTVTRNTTWHRYQHLNEGMRWLSGGMPTYVQDEASQVGISLTSPIRVADEDLEHLILHNPSPNNPFEQVLEGGAEMPVLWLDSTGHYQANTPTKYPFPHDGTGILVNTINELDSTGSLEAVPNGKFVSMFIMASHCSNYPVKIITGRVVSDTVAEARDESLLSYGINMPEFAYLYHLVFEKGDSVTENPGKVRLAAVMEPARPVNSAAPNIGANDHQGLSNRVAPDSHPIGAISGLQVELAKPREWATATVTKEEAEASSGEARKAWTVTRIIEAIQAWWNRSTMKSKLDGIQAGAQVNEPTNLGQEGTGNSQTITSSTGEGVTVSIASTSNAGFMSTADKTKLDGITDYVQTKATEAGQGAINYADQTFIEKLQKAQPNGVATLDTMGKVPATQLELKTINGEEITGEGDFTIEVVPTNLSQTITANTLTIHSSTGDDVELPTATSTKAGLMSSADKQLLGTRQAQLVSGSNIKTVNNQSILGSGNITIDTAAANVMSAIASAQFGAVGTYAFVAYVSTNNAIRGSTMAGAALRPAGLSSHSYYMDSSGSRFYFAAEGSELSVYNPSSAGLAGTWRVMSEPYATISGNKLFTALCMRIL